MPRETKYTAIILKKQPYGEGDEILTLFTEERGKVRALAKSVKLAKSKLQSFLQACFLVKVTLTVSALPKFIAVEVVNAFPGIRENLEAVNMAFFALETVLKGTADEHKNRRLFFALNDFFTFLDSHKNRADLLQIGLVKYKIEFLNCLGFSIHAPEELLKSVSTGSSPIAFSLSRGGFISEPDIGDAIYVPAVVLGQFSQIKAMSFGRADSPEGLPKIFGSDFKTINNLLSRFINYQLEREIKSEKYL